MCVTSRHKRVFWLLALGLGAIIMASCGGVEDNSVPVKPLPPGPIDSDSDGIRDSFDNCPMIWNQSQSDVDGDGIGDSCDTDADNDGIDDAVDNCPLTPNTDQLDTDGDGIGEICDDNDNDLIGNLVDNCVETFNPFQEDLDGDGIGDVCDPDDDNDMVDDTIDNCPRVYNPSQTDADLDGLGTACDDEELSIVLWDSTASLQGKLCAQNEQILYPIVVTLRNTGNVKASLLSVTCALYDKTELVGSVTREAGITPLTHCDPPEAVSSDVPLEIAGCGGEATFTIYVVSQFITRAEVSVISFTKRDNPDCQ